MATRLLLSVLLYSALVPMATLECPVVLEYKETSPFAVLEYPLILSNND